MSAPIVDEDQRTDEFQALIPERRLLRFRRAALSLDLISMRFRNVGTASLKSRLSLLD